MLKDHVDICSFDGCELYVENIIIHVLVRLHVALIMYVTGYSMKWHIHISYARDIALSRVCAWYWLFTILGEYVVSSKMRRRSKLRLTVA